MRSFRISTSTACRRMTPDPRVVQIYRMARSRRLARRFLRYYGSLPKHSWEAFCREAVQNPKMTFACVGDLKMAGQLYELKWG